MTKIDTPLARTITERAATHSLIIKRLGISRGNYYKKLAGRMPFTDAELRQMAKVSTISVAELRELQNSAK